MNEILRVIIAVIIVPVVIGIVIYLGSLPPENDEYGNGL
jgi:hypothetical protein